MGNLKKIIIHWSAGTNKVNGIDLSHYHFIIDGDGKVYNGKYTPEDNINCNDGKYAQHTAQGNTGAIGVSMAGMAGFSEKTKSTKYPITAKQCEKMFELCAQLCKKYGIQVTPTTVLTHYEFDCNRGLAGRKIDIVYLPPYPNIKKDEVGNFIRNKIKWYISKIG